MLDPLLLTEFDKWMSRRGNRPITRFKDIETLKKVYKHIPSVTFDSFDQWLQERKDQGQVTASLMDNVVAVRKYHQFLKETGKEYIEELRTHKIPYPKKNSYKPTLSDQEIEQIVNFPPQYEKTRKFHERMSLFFRVLSVTGLRPNELASMRVNSVDWGMGVLIVYPEISKTNQLRYAPIPKQKDILDGLQGLTKGNKQTDYLFIGKNNKRFVAYDWGYHFRFRAKRLGISRPKVSTYSLRHSFATALLNEDVNLFKVQKLMGHTQTATTQVYYHSTTKDLFEAQKRLPLLRKNLSPHEIYQSIREFINSLNLDDKFSLSVKEIGNTFTVEVSCNP